MARSFSKAQLRAAIDTVQAVGLEIHAIEFPPAGGFKLVLNPERIECEVNPWDEALGIEPSTARLRR